VQTTKRSADPFEAASVLGSILDVSASKIYGMASNELEFWLERFFETATVGEAIDARNALAFLLDDIEGR